jgi:hypothetical protein
MRNLLIPATIALAALAHPAAAARTLTFDVLREGTPIGTHRVTIDDDGPQRQVTIEIDMAVKIAFVTVFRYTHRARETWEGGRLTGLDATTDDNGTRTQVRAQATAQGLAVTGSGGSYVAPADTMPASYWNRDKLDRTALLDAQSGKLAKVASTPAGEAPASVDGRAALVAKYLVRGDLNAELGYAADGSWAALSFEARGARIDYVRRSAVDMARSG